ncbi:hypothetical protein K1T71_012159 [Dendrolimus kikuchii]|uniref:Uncharacterized protein n=1 Tax=Dendrolimus kikuchii TaxID=765133 RepID=A0ACC1CKS4_9NEOP|nr:hypothetical protein K1T71_012159 [Dendrolimus kikuchii]
MKLLILFALALCAYAAEMKNDEKEKRQAREGHLGGQLVYRAARKQEAVAPVEEPQEDDKASISRSDDQYRPGQVFSVNAQELLELQPERKAPVTGNQQFQQLYINPQQDQQDHQQFYFLEPQVGRQVSLQPSHAVITRPVYSSNGGEAAVGAALSVSDTGANSANAFDHDLLALLGQGQIRQEDTRLVQEDPRAQTYPQRQPQAAPTLQNVAPQYQQVERYVAKPNKKSAKSHAKIQNTVTTSPLPTAPQQYLIETTNVQQQQHQIHEQQQQVHEEQHQIQEPQHQQVQYRPAHQQQRLPQALRYMPIQPNQAVQQVIYERPDTQGLKIVAAPKLQQSQHQRPAESQQQRAQLAYKIVPQYTQSEISPKQYRIVEAPRSQPVRQEHRVTSPSLERPVAYLKRYPEPEKQRAVKIYEPQEQLPQQQVQGGEQYYLRPVYRTSDQRQRYELPAVTTKPEHQRVLEQAKASNAAAYVNKNLAPRKVVRLQQVPRDQNIKNEQSSEELSHRLQQTTNVENVNIEQHGRSLAEQRASLPPPKNNKAYTPEEFAALVAAGYAVTPVPVSALSLGIAQSRSSEEAVTSHPVRMLIPRARLSHSRRHQYLPLRGDDAP